MSRRGENFYDKWDIDYSNSTRFELGDVLLLKSTFSYTPVDYESLGFVGTIEMCEQGNLAIVLKVKREYIVVSFPSMNHIAIIDTPTWWFKNLSHEKRQD